MMGKTVFENRIEHFTAKNRVHLYLYCQQPNERRKSQRNNKGKSENFELLKSQIIRWFS